MDNLTFVNNSTQTEVLEWARYTFICFMTLVTVLGIPGNILILAVLIKLRNKASTDFLVLTMCVVDLISSTFNSTLFIFRYKQSIWKMLASSELCRLHVFTICITVISTTLLLAATAFDRHRKTKSSSMMDTHSTIKKSKCICIGIICFSFVYSIVYVFTITIDMSSLECIPITNYRNMAIIFSSLLSVVFMFMFVIVIVCYSRIAIILRRHHRQLFQPNQNINNTDVPLKSRFWSRNRIQPIGQDTNIDNSTNQNSNNSYDINNSDTKSTYLQNGTSSRNEDPSLLTVSQKVHYNDNDSEQSQQSTRRLFDVTNQEGANSTKHTQPRLTARRVDNVEKERRKINTTTLMMFLITLIYVTTWIINWSTQIYKAATNRTSLKTDFLTERLYMINCITNPILYIFMSTKFRMKAREMFCK